MTLITSYCFEKKISENFSEAKIWFTVILGTFKSPLYLNPPPYYVFFWQLKQQSGYILESLFYWYNNNTFLHDTNLSLTTKDFKAFYKPYCDYKNFFASYWQVPTSEANAATYGGEF